MLDQVALFKYRTYRFQKELRKHIVAELIENNACNGNELSDAEKHYLKIQPNIKKSYISSNEVCSPYDNSLIDEALSMRLELTNQKQEYISPKKVIHIIGAPRSGTSYLYNLLTFSNIFSYFTSDSHQLWGCYNLRNSPKTFFENMNSSILDINTKKVRLMYDVCFPSEAEHIWNNFMPVYKHISHHHYKIIKLQSNNLEGLKDKIKEHCSFFNRDYFLSKSPFNSFRKSELSELFPSETFFIHIYRDKNKVAQSIKNNNFRFSIGSHHEISSEHSRDLFFTASLSSMNDNTLMIAYEDLIANPSNIVKSIMEYVGA